ncbi:Ferrichrome outer membrane transporter/phage receptor [compost metagenome]
MHPAMTYAEADGRTLGRNFSSRKLEWDDRDVQLNLTGYFKALGLEHTLLTGVEYEDFHYKSLIRRSSGALDSYPIDIFEPVSGQPRPALTRTTTHDNEKLQTWALFVQDQIPLTERLKLLAGVRIERFEHDYRNYLPGSRSWEKADKAVMPRAGLIYDLTDSLAVYVNAARSYKPNSGASRLGAGFDPEQGKSYEVGVKWEALDGQLSVNAAVYHIAKQNLLTLDPLDPGFSVAAGEVRSRGFDLNLAGNITPEWRLIGGYAFVDAEVRKDNNLPSGTPLANIPRNSFSLLNMYEFQDGAAKGLGLGLAVKYVDERAGQTSATTYEIQDYGVVDLLSFYKLNEDVRLNLDLKNLFNEEYEEGAFNFYAYPGAPRTVQFGIAYTF